MQEVRFSINNKQFNDAIDKLGDRSELYGFAKDAFLKKLEEMKTKRKEVWFECPNRTCHESYHVTVKANIEEKTGRLIPVCAHCGWNLVRRSKVVNVKD